MTTGSPIRAVAASAPWKGTHRATGVAAAIARGLRAARAEIEVAQVPLADGGEGTLDALQAAEGGRRVSVEARDPLGRPRRAEVLLLPGGHTAVVEVAQACGLPLLRPEERDPARTTTAGVGDLVRSAAEAGAREVWLGVGGTATVDGGAGLLAALGALPLDAGGRPVPEGGLGLARVERLDLSRLSSAIRSLRIRVLADVSAPLTGLDGAARAFGPQKGASPDLVDQLDEALARWAGILWAATGRDPAFGPPGMGAGGGIPAALWAVLGATVEPGAEAVILAARLRERLEGAALVVTGEGSLDATTRLGKAPHAVARIARALGVPCAFLVGHVGAGATAPPGIEVVECSRSGGGDATLADVEAAARSLGARLLPARAPT